MLAFLAGPAARYLVGAAIMVVVVGGSYRWGVSSERGKQAEVDLETTRKQATIDQQHREQVAAATAENQNLANRVESEAHTARTTIESLAEDNRRLAASTGGRLRDPNASACQAANRVPKAGDTARAADPAADGQLSEKLTGLLLSESRRADQAAAYAATCYNWVRGLTP